jgi:hypothetical protein
MHTKQCELVLRIRADDPTAELPLGSKYGANIDEVGNTYSIDIQITQSYMTISHI